MRKLTALFATLFLAGCATKYQSFGFSGGFSEVQLDTNVFRVSFKGNGYSSGDRVEEMALLRSAEVTLNNGFTHFAVVTGTTRENPDSIGIGISVTKPGASNTIVCYRGKPEGAGLVYDAKYVFDSLGEKYGVK